MFKCKTHLTVLSRVLLQMISPSWCGIRTPVSWLEKVIQATALPGISKSLNVIEKPERLLQEKNFFFEENEATAAKHYFSKNSEHVENKSKHRSKKIINLGPTSAIRGGTSLFLEPEPSPGLWNLIMDRAKVWLRDIAFFDLSGARLWSSDNASWSFRLVAPLSLSLV